MQQIINVAVDVTIIVTVIVTSYLNFVLPKAMSTTTTQNARRNAVGNAEHYINMSREPKDQVLLALRGKSMRGASSQISALNLGAKKTTKTTNVHNTMSGTSPASSTSLSRALSPSITLTQTSNPLLPPPRLPRSQSQPNLTLTSSSSPKSYTHHDYHRIKLTKSLSPLSQSNLRVDNITTTTNNNNTDNQTSTPAPTTIATTNTNGTEAAAKLAEALDDFLGDVERKFKGISEEILTRLDEMAERCDRLEGELLRRETGIVGAAVAGSGTGTGMGMGMGDGKAGGQ